MPITKSAIKKMRQDKAREKTNRVKKAAIKKALKASLESKDQKNLSQAFSLLDKAAKVGLIPKGRADRKKSRLSKKISIQKAQTKPTKKAIKTPKK